MFSNDSESAERLLGTLDMIFMLSYAVGLVINGKLGDQLNLRKFLSFGMFCAGVSVCMFGVSGILKAYNVYYYCIIWVLNGLFQSIGWPAIVAVMGNWFGHSSRGAVMVGLMYIHNTRWK